MQQTRIYFRPNYGKFARYALLFLLLILAALAVRNEILGYLSKPLDFFRGQQNTICNAKENGTNTRDKGKEQPRIRQRVTVKHENGSPKIGLPETRKYILPMPKLKQGDVWKKGIKVAPIQTFTRKTGISHFWRPAKREERARNEQHKNGIGLRFVPFKNYRL